jgi:alcohol dehydrogenase class IV
MHRKNQNSVLLQQSTSSPLIVLLDELCVARMNKKKNAMTGYNCMKHAVEGVGFKEKLALTDKEQRV